MAFTRIVADLGESDESRWAAANLVVRALVVIAAGYIQI
jgi:hypothetical protein